MSTYSSNPGYEILDIRKITVTQLCILLLCFFSMMLDGFDIVIISFTAPAISRDWMLNSEQLGLAFSSGLLGMTFGAMVMSSIADLYGRRLVISGALVVAGLATSAIFISDSLTELVLARFAAGVGLGTLLTVTPALSGEYSPQTRRNFILAIICSGGNLGAVIGGLISAWAIPEYGWRVLYLYTGIITTLTGVLFYLIVPESIAYLTARRKDNSLEKVNKILDYIGQGRLSQLPENTNEKMESASVKSLLTPSRRATTFLAWGAFCMAFASMYFMTSWLPKLFVDSGIPEEQSIQAVVILTFGSILGAMSIGWLSKWWKLNHLIAVSFILATVLTIMLSMALHQSNKSFSLIWTISFLIGVTLNGAFVNLYAVALTIYPTQIRITGVGWCYGLGRGGAIISPVVAGLLLGSGVSAANVVACFAITIAFAGCLTWLIQVREMAT